MIRALLQGAWNLGHRRRYQRLEDRVERLEYWVRIHSPLLVRKDSVPSPYEDPIFDPLAIWDCKIGEIDRVLLPAGSDAPMREAVRQAYRQLTGREPRYIFSGWGATLTDVQREVIEGWGQR